MVDRIKFPLHLNRQFEHLVGVFDATGPLAVDRRQLVHNSYPKYRLLPNWRMAVIKSRTSDLVSLRRRSLSFFALR